MYSLIVRMMLRRGETNLFISSVALLVALPAATVSISYPLRLHLERIYGGASPGGLYLVVRGGASPGGILDPTTIDILRGFDPIACIAVERAVEDAAIYLGSGSYRVRLRFIDDIRSYIDLLGARVEGRIPTGGCEVLVGASIAERYSLKPSDTVRLAVGSLSLDVEVAGIARFRSQSDYEIIASTDIAGILGFDGASAVEFRFKHGVDEGGALAMLSGILPKDTKIYGSRRIIDFAYMIDRQVAEFVYIWIIPVYMVLAVSSYVSSMNLIAGCSYELAMLRALGARRGVAAYSILAYVTLTSTLGSIIGLSIGLTGVQIASKILGWVAPSVSLTPTLNLYDATIIASTAVSTSIIGSLPHVFGSSKTSSIEGSL
ncbi:MAG: hypothetical protein QXQ29_00185 [Candidatus Bathyarchaeia archaeon]